MECTVIVDQTDSVPRCLWMGLELLFYVLPVIVAIVFLNVVINICT